MGLKQFHTQVLLGLLQQGSRQDASRPHAIAAWLQPTMRHSSGFGTFSAGFYRLLMQTFIGWMNTVFFTSLKTLINLRLPHCKPCSSRSCAFTEVGEMPFKSFHFSLYLGKCTRKQCL